MVHLDIHPEFGSSWGRRNMRALEQSFRTPIWVGRWGLHKGDWPNPDMQVLTVIGPGC